MIDVSVIQWAVSVILGILTGYTAMTLQTVNNRLQGIDTRLNQMQSQMATLVEAQGRVQGQMAETTNTVTNLFRVIGSRSGDRVSG
jgi:flagellin-like hook-associated protein FlgL